MYSQPGKIFGTFAPLLLGLLLGLGFFVGLGEPVVAEGEGVLDGVRDGFGLSEASRGPDPFSSGSSASTGAWL